MHALGIEFIFQTAAIGITVAVLHKLLVQSGREEQAMMVTMAGLIVVMLMVVDKIALLFDSIKTLFTY